MTIQATALRPAALDQAYAYHLNLSPNSRRTPDAIEFRSRDSSRDLRMPGAAAEEELRGLGLSHSCLCFLTTVPLAKVGWHSFNTTGLRRHAMLEAASRHGMEPGLTPYQLLNSWLLARPDASLFRRVWHDDIGAIGRVTGADTYHALRNWLLTTANAIACCSADGFGLLEKCSNRNVAIDRIENAFD